ncbi:NAD(P)H-binding protein [Streptomyces sp. NBC_01264]|uniref:NmrA family NAD(P)-binding protein n=1 Tax=Streptomyces sp. NBC_01264 TaxID=2903804 RepID=UPI0022511A63|nr:NAD(P)H-binding protein [Streptomyces sp. NBC_01264]MCX4783654.1 NAD(P)H-binding protein [Streptomyces sp. NBC_01264]
MTDTTVLVLGGTGKTGRRVVNQLKERGATVRAASRSGDVRFDWDDAGTWEPALAGVDVAYLVDAQDKPGVWDADAALRKLSGLAVDSGVRRLVLLQARVSEPVGGKSLIAGERAVQESGAEWTVLRPNWFFQNFDEGVLLDGVRAGELSLPAGSGREPFVDAEDVAAVAVEALLEDGHAGQTYELSGARALTLDEAVSEIARATGRDIRYVPVEHQAYVDELVGYDVPADYALFVADLVAQIRDDKNATPTDTVRRVLGREPRDFSDFVKDAAARGVWNV